MSDTVRFIHAADLHLDAPFAGVEAQDDRVRRALVASTYEAFGRVVDACIDRDAEFLVIAGDVYNSRDRSLRAQLAFGAQMERLAQAGIDVFVARGNHDPADGWSARLALPDRVHYFSTAEVERAEVRREGTLRCALYGRSFATSAETANLAREFERDPGDAIAIGVLHTNVGANKDYEPYAPCSVEDLRAARMDYWALGHIHKSERVSDTPRAAYAGSPQGLNPKERGAHGCYLVEVGPGAVTEEFIETASVRWEKTSVSIDCLDTIDDVRAAVRAACASMRSASATPVVCRIDLVGRSAVHANLVRGTTLDDLVADLREDEFAEAPWLWVDRVRDMTSPPLDLDSLRQAPDFAGDLVRIADAILDNPAEVDALIAATLGPLEANLGAVDLGLGAREIIERSRDICLDRLLEDGDGR